MRIISFCVALMLVGTAPVGAEDGTTFRRTTPRAPLHVAVDGLVFGVPSGRAWGLESKLIPIGSQARVALDLGVRDAGVREAFVRIAWYDRDQGRPRQMHVQDSAIVPDGVRRRIVMELEAPDGAVAFRIRVLARVTPGTPASREDALSIARVRVDRSIQPRPALTRLWAEPP